MGVKLRSPRRDDRPEHLVAALLPFSASITSISLRFSFDDPPVTFPYDTGRLLFCVELDLHHPTTQQRLLHGSGA